MWIMKTEEPNELINLSFALRIYAVDGAPTYDGQYRTKIIADFGHDRLMVICVADNKQAAADIMNGFYEKLNNFSTESTKAIPNSGSAASCNKGSGGGHTSVSKPKPKTTKPKSVKASSTTKKVD